MKNSEKDKSFEENIDELEKIVKKLESGKLSLENSIEEFQKGIELYKICNEYLSKADGEIKAVIEDKEVDLNMGDDSFV